VSFRLSTFIISPEPSHKIPEKERSYLNTVQRSSGDDPPFTYAHSISALACCRQLTLNFRISQTEITSHKSTYRYKSVLGLDLQERLVGGTKGTPWRLRTEVNGNRLRVYLGVSIHHPLVYHHLGVARNAWNSVQAGITHP
jgi:hypothetical protein